MSGKNTKRLIKVAKEFNVGISTIVDFLHKEGFDEIKSNPNTKISQECYDALVREYRKDIEIKKEKEKFTQKNLKAKKDVIPEEQEEAAVTEEEENIILIKDTSELSESKPVTKRKKDSAKKETVGIKVVDKVELDSKGEVKKTEEKPKADKKQSTKESSDKISEKQKDDKNKEAALKQEQVEETEKKKSEQQEKNSPDIDKIDTKTVAEDTKSVDNIEENEEEKATGDEDSASENEVKVIGKIDLSSLNQKTRPKRKTKAEKKDARIKKEREQKELREKERLAKRQTADDNKTLKERPKKQTKPETETKPENEFIKTKVEKLSGPTVLGKIELPTGRDGSGETRKKSKKKRRKRIVKEQVNVDSRKENSNSEKSKRQKNKNKRFKKPQRVEVDDSEVQKQIKETLAKLTAPKGKSKGSKYRRDKRDEIRNKIQDELAEQEIEKQIIKVTEFVTANELASMMDIPVTEVIQACMNLGLFVSINERLDAETISLLVEDFGFQVEFVSVDLQEAIAEEEDAASSADCYCYGTC